MTPLATPQTLLKPDGAKVDVGKPRGLYDTTDIREKVLKWQNIAEPSVPGNNGVAEEAGKRRGRSGQDSPRQQEKEDAVLTEPEQRAEESKRDLTLPRNQVQPRTLGADLRAASAPRKRVVSDEHWKKMRSSPQNGTDSSPIPQTPLGLVVEHEFYVRPGSNKIDAWMRRKSTPSKDSKPQVDKTPLKSPAVDEVHRKERRASCTVTGDAAQSLENVDVPEGPDSGLKSAKELTSSKSKKGERLTAASSREAMAAAGGTPKSASPRADKVPREKQPSRDISPLPSSTQASINQKRSKRRTGSLDADSKDSAAAPPDPAPAVALHVFGNRVEAWLTGTSDPFIEGADDPEVENHSPVETADTGLVLKPRSVKIRSKDCGGRKGGTFGERTEFSIRRRISTETDPDSPPRVHDLRREIGYFTPRSTKLDVEDSAEDVMSDTSMPPTPTLKRRGARRDTTSPRKSTKERPATTIHVPQDLGLSSQPVEAEDSIRLTKDESLSIINRLSTVASAASLQMVTQAPKFAIHHQKSTNAMKSANASLQVEDNLETSHRPRLKRKMASHSDLMSVLSMPDADGKGILPAHSVRSGRSKFGPATAIDLMKELKAGEVNYLRELRTMVDGVIPVLLSCVLSKSSSAVAAGLFNNTKTESDATTLIVNMGVALERLKSVHLRMPTTSPDALLQWAQGSQSIYVDYLRAWRMGFNDVVVNLAPIDQDSMRESCAESPRDAALPRDDDGYIVDNEGVKLDVAFLLKRPLVRLKYLTRALKGIDNLQHSTRSSLCATQYQDLVDLARRRVDEERARLEDEAAANIDPTKAREPQTLAPLAGVRINPSRRVRARDVFHMTLDHSTGQRMDCGVELLFRDDPPSCGSGGDVLICELDSTSRWLLFPPAPIGHLSARLGDLDHELVIMIHGRNGQKREWRELLSLRSSNADTCHEWVRMLGSVPHPPQMSSEHRPLTDKLSVQTGLLPNNSRSYVIASTTNVDVPIGEQAVEFSKQWRSQSYATLDGGLPGVTKSSPVSLHASPGQSQALKLPYSLPTTPSGSRHTALQDLSHCKLLSGQKRLAGRHEHDMTQVQGIYQTFYQTSSAPPSPPPHQQQPSKSTGPYLDRRPMSAADTAASRSTSNYIVWYPTERPAVAECDQETFQRSTRQQSPQRPAIGRRISNVPSDAPPSIARVRGGQLGSTDAGLDIAKPATSPTIKQEGLPENIQMTYELKDVHLDSNAVGTKSRTSPVQSPSQFRAISAPQHDPTTPTSNARRSSSPLKREYCPSSGSESSSAMGDIQSDDDESFTSDSSADEMMPDPFLPLAAFKSRVRSGTSTSVYLPQTPATLSPSQSASQGPYRAVPPQMEQATKTIASLFCWSDKGAWESIHPDECSIVVTPGLIEAFKMSAAHSTAMNGEDADSARPECFKPLVALELTPLVPLRRGTALDISIRSPPTTQSQFRNGNNIMFRSRNGQECEALYNLINQARINNPTYIALQNARGPFGGSNWGSYMDRRANMRNTSSWWRFGSKKSSYRAGNTIRTASIVQTETSVATVSTTMSALKRFSGSSRMFNVAKSTITSRGGVSRSSTSELTSSSGSSGGPMLNDLDPAKGTPAGITNVKIRMYYRETPSKWRDMGAARLTIMHPPRPTSLLISGSGVLKQEKRVLVVGKTQGETLLDVTLGETCFERVARTGIAVSVWEQLLGPNGEVGQVGKTGGVVSARARVYMIQMNSEAETAYTFSLVGRLRY